MLRLTILLGAIFLTSTDAVAQDNAAVPAEKVVQQGITGFRISLDEAGNLVDCTITQPSGVAELDAKACEILRNKGKFRPKISSDGKPEKSEINSRIVWKITE